MLAAVALQGCAAQSAQRAGRQAERLEDYDRAVLEYNRALRQKPEDMDVRAALERVKMRAAQQHFSSGRRLAGAGKLEEALLELQVASELNPRDGEAEELLRKTRNELRAKLAVTREGKTPLETLIERSRDLAPAGFELPKQFKLADSLVFRNASVRDIYTSIGHFSGLSVVFDPAFRDAALTIDLRDSFLEDALQAVSTSTRNFYRVTAARTITVVPDTAAKRREYEEEIIRTFYLSNADVKEMLDVLRLVVDNRRISPVPGINAIAIKDTPEKIAAAAKVISAVDKARAEVVIDVELVEVDRTKLSEYGVQFASPGQENGGISGGVDVNRKDFTLRDLRSLTQSDVFLTGLPGLFYKLIKNDTHTRVLANPQLRTSEGLAAEARFGERVPVPSVTFAPIATGGVNQQPITSFNYEDVGVSINIVPRLHHDDEVSMTIKLEVSSLSGTGFNGLPTFGNRYLSTTIRLKDGETNLLAGLIQDEERRATAGIPGLASLPVVGRIFADNRKETQQTDIILMLTPRIVRVLDLTESDLRPFRVGRDQGPTALDLPLPQDNPAPVLPPRDQPPAGAVPEPQPADPQASPLFPGGVRPGVPGEINRPKPSDPNAPPPADPKRPNIP